MNITDDTFTYEREQQQIAQEAELDGIYVIRARQIDPDPVANATRSRAAIRKAARRRSPEQEPCHTIASLFDELENRTRKGSDRPSAQLSTPTELQAQALTLVNERVPQNT